MRYAILMRPHSNARYAVSLEKLALCELECFLRAMELEAKVEVKDMGGGRFLCFETDELSKEQIGALSLHSAMFFFAKAEGELLRPIDIPRESYLPDDFSQVLKYKGKTNVEFTKMMINCALCASGQLCCGKPLTVLDPIAGHGTTLLCALEQGMNAIGVEIDQKAVTETAQYVDRYLQYHRIKHKKENLSMTLGAGKSAKGICYTLADTLEHYKQGNTRTLKLFCQDTQFTDKLAGKLSCDLIIGDLPYGIQHAPREGKQLGELETLLRRSLPAYLPVLRPGGAIAMSFNTYTLGRSLVIEQMDRAGFTPLTQPPYNDFEHWVEQAVNRDFVVAVR